MVDLAISVADLPGTVIAVRADTGDTFYFTISAGDGTLTVSEYLCPENNRRRVAHITTYRPGEPIK